MTKAEAISESRQVTKSESEEEVIVAPSITEIVEIVEEKVPAAKAPAKKAVVKASAKKVVEEKPAAKKPAAKKKE
jgi:hypothetical protein